MDNVTDLGQAISISLSNVLFMILGAIPHVLAFLVILLVGWFIAGLLSKAIAALLRSVHFNDLTQRAGITDFVQRMGVKTDPAGLVAQIVSWFVRLMALIVAFDALGLPAVSQVIQQFLLWIPNLIVAMVILVIAGLLANALGDIVRGSTSKAGLGNPDLLATIARVAVWGFAIIIAVNQIGIASTLVNTLFMGFVGALALALGLAFGLGGRDTAAKMVSGWYDQAQEAAPKMGRAAEAAKQQTQQAGAKMQDEVQRLAPQPRNQ